MSGGRAERARKKDAQNRARKEVAAAPHAII